MLSENIWWRNLSSLAREWVVVRCNDECEHHVGGLKLSLWVGFDGCAVLTLGFMGMAPPSKSVYLGKCDVVDREKIEHMKVGLLAKATKFKSEVVDCDCYRVAESLHAEVNDYLSSCRNRFAVVRRKAKIASTIKYSVVMALSFGIGLLF